MRFFQTRFPVEFLLEGLRDALARFVVGPAVIVAAQAALLHEAVGEVGRAVLAVARDQPVGSREVAVDDQVLPHDAHRFDRALVQLAHRRDGMPVAAQQLAHRRSRADPREGPVLFRAQHGFTPPSRPTP